MLYHTQPGDIVVVDARGDMTAGVFGEMMMTYFAGRGGIGIVIDGCIRDFPEAKKLDLGLWLRGVTPNFHTQTGIVPFAVNVPIGCNNVLVMPGDIIVADDDGAVVVPAGMAEALLAKASTHHEWEEFSACALAKAATCVGITRCPRRRGPNTRLGSRTRSADRRETEMMNRRAVLATAAALLGGFGPAHAQTVGDLKAKGKLVVGVMVDVPPFALLDENNQPSGYDVDVARALARRMGVPLEMVVVTGPNRIPYLLTGKVDMLVAVLGIIPERTKVVLFSEPYAGFSNFIYGRKELPIHSMADLKGLTVAVPRANTSDILLTREAPKGTTILRFDDDAAVRAALLARQVDATSMSSINLPAVEHVIGKDAYERKFDLLTQGRCCKLLQRPRWEKLESGLFIRRPSDRDAVSSTGRPRKGRTHRARRHARRGVPPRRCHG